MLRSVQPSAVNSSQKTRAGVGGRLRLRRIELGLSQRDLALGCGGVSSSFIGRIEGGNRVPSTKTLRKIAPVLRVSVHWLETGDQHPAEQLAHIVLHHRRALPAEASRLAKLLLEAASEPA